MPITLDPLKLLALAFGAWINQQQQDVIEYLKEENRVLREQLGNRRLRLTNEQRIRLAVRGKTLGRKLLDQLATIVTPDTLMRWHRKLIAAKYDGSSQRAVGRPTVMKEIRRLVIQMAQENRTWGYTRIQGALKNLKHEVGRGTIATILKEAGIEPAPERSGKTTWRDFLKTHWSVLAAADFFTVEVWTRTGLCRYLVLFVMELSTRSVQIAGIARDGNRLWMSQIARNLCDIPDGLLTGKRFLIHDRDPLFTGEFLDILAASGITAVKLPPRSPNLNAYAERFVRTAKESCLNRMIFCGEGSLRLAVSELIEHYHRERNHQGLGNRIILPEPGTVPKKSVVRRRTRLGGMLNYYYRDAA